MKKLLALLLSMLMLLGMFTGCSLFDSDEDDDDDDRKSSVSKRDEDEEEEEEEEQTKPSEQEDEEADPPAQTGYVRGVSDPSGWTSEYLGLQFKVPAGLIMSTEDEMLELMQIGLEAMDYGQQVIDYALLTTVYEMMAVDISGNNIIVMAEKLPLQNMTEQMYAEAVKQNLTTQAVAQYQVGDPFETNFCGVDCLAMVSAVTANGKQMSQYYYFFKIDDRMFSIAITAVTEGFLDTALSGFSAC